MTVLNGSGASSPAAADAVFTAPLTIITDGDGSVLLYMSNGAVLEVKPGSRIEISHFSQEPFEVSSDPFQPAATEPSSSQVSINVISGEVAAKVPALGSGSTFLINTPTSNIVANDIVVVVDYNAQTAETQVSNVGGNGNVVYESNTAGSQPVSVPAGQAVTAPGQIDPATGAATTSGQPTVAPASPSAIEAGQQVSNPPAPTPSNPAQPTTPPTAPSTTPELDIPDLINPTTTEPN